MSDLVGLIERVEALTEPSREVDHAIRHHVHGDAQYCDFDTGYTCGACKETGCGKPLGLFDERRSYPNDWRDDERLPRYTASIDAALTLVPEGWQWTAGNNGQSPTAYLWNCIKDPDAGGQDAEADHTSVAIALCIAALRARQAKEADRGD